MGKSSGGETLTSYQAPQTTVPNSPQVNNQAQARLNAASPEMMSPYRAMDYLSGYTAPSSTVPTAPGSTGAMGSAMAASTGLSGNNFTGGPGTTASATQPQATAAQTQPGVPGASGQGQNWWNQPMTSQAMAGMAQNVQSSLGGLAQLLGKGSPNPAPQQTQTAQSTPKTTPQQTQTAQSTPKTTQKASA